MTDIDLLPVEIKVKSLSDKEIVLNYEDSLKVLDILLSANLAFLGWEGWIKYLNGRVGHVSDYQGTISIEQEKEELWKHYQKRSYEGVKKTIEDSNKKWQNDSRSKEHQLYFCITTINEKNINI